MLINLWKEYQNKRKTKKDKQRMVKFNYASQDQIDLIDSGELLTRHALLSPDTHI